MSEIKMIAMDLDGTLFRDDKTISAENQKAIRDAQAHGIRTVICTGRLPEDVEDYLKNYGLTMERICCNGAITLKGDAGREEVLQQRSFVPEEAKALTLMLSQYPLMINAFIRGCTITAAPDPTQRYHLVERGIVREDRGSEALLRAADSGIFKFYLTWQRGLENGLELLHTVREAVQDRFPHFELSRSSPSMLEIMPHGITKGTALLALGQFFQIEPENIMAIGDEENDLPMLNSCKYSVAMGNASPQVKEACRLLTTSNQEDGVAEAIRFAMDEPSKVIEPRN